MRYLTNQGHGDGAKLCANPSRAFLRSEKARRKRSHARRRKEPSGEIHTSKIGVFGRFGCEKRDTGWRESFIGSRVSDLARESPDLGMDLLPAESISSMAEGRRWTPLGGSPASAKGERGPVVSRKEERGGGAVERYPGEGARGLGFGSRVGGESNSLPALGRRRRRQVGLSRQWLWTWGPRARVRREGKGEGTDRLG